MDGSYFGPFFGCISVIIHIFGDFIKKKKKFSQKSCKLGGHPRRIFFKPELGLYFYIKYSKNRWENLWVYMIFE